MFFLVACGDKKVSRIPESNVGICGSWPVQASNCHVTTRVFSVIEFKKCTQTLKIIPFQCIAPTRPLPQGIRFLLQRNHGFWQRHGVKHIEADAVTLPESAFLLHRERFCCEKTLMDRPCCRRRQRHCCRCSCPCHRHCNHLCRHRHHLASQRRCHHCCRPHC
jgi:hypothetical protein